MPISPRFAGRLLPAVLLSCLLAVVSQAAEKHSSFLAALNSITAEELKRHVDYLADDRLEGRLPGTRGGKAAGDYLAEEFKALRLRGGVDGKFFQPFAPNYRNVVALLEGSDPVLKKQVILVGAHYDHVGYGTWRNSRGPVGQVHNGADDNASGTAALLELAQAFTFLNQPPKRSILFLGFDAEELGLFGSKHWVTHPTVPPEQVVAMINMDMIGRLRNDRLHLYGSRSGYGLRRLISRHNEGLRLRLDFSWDLKRSADHYLFFQRNIPVVLLHTGLHGQYHTPRDDAELINHGGMSRVVRLLFGVVHELANCPQPPRFRKAAERETETSRRQLAARVPKLPDRLGVGIRRAPSTEGVLVTRVASGSPAEKAGLRGGDRIVRFAGREVHTVDELIGSVRAAKNPARVALRRAGRDEPVELTVQLAGKPMRLGITWRVDEAEPGAVILTYVVPGSPAAKAGLCAGDRIYQVAGHELTDDTQFARLARTLPEPLHLLVERKGQIRTVMLFVQTEPLKRAA